MSERYIQRLRAVRQEFDIAREVLEYILSNRHQSGIAAAFTHRTPTQLERVLRKLELTYFVRLTAEFEGILKDHLRTNHPDVVFPIRQSDWKLDWFRTRVLQKEHIKLDAILRRKLDEVRDYRNAVAHGNAAAVPLSFAEALARYNTLLAKLPEPHS